MKPPNTQTGLGLTSVGLSGPSPGGSLPIPTDRWWITLGTHYPLALKQNPFLLFNWLQIISSRHKLATTPALLIAATESLLTLPWLCGDQSRLARASHICGEITDQGPRLTTISLMLKQKLSAKRFGSSVSTFPEIGSAFGAR